MSEHSFDDPDLRPPRRRWRPRWTLRRLVALTALAIGVAGVAVYGLQWWRYLQAHVSTDDAYVTGRIAPVSARVSSHVTEVVVRDNQEVQAGDVLVRLDAREYQVALAEARAAVETAR